MDNNVLDHFLEDADDFTVTCPKCKSEQQVPTPVSVITPADDADLEKLFKGILNAATCCSCEAQFLIDLPILYRDDSNRALIYFMNIEERSQTKEAEDQMKVLAAKVFGDEEEEESEIIPEIRLTTSRRHFIEKIALHAHGLDDRLIEYIKFQMYNRETEKVDPVRFELLYDFSNQDNDKIAFLVYDRETGKASAGAHIPMDLYKEIWEMFSGSGTSLHEELSMLFPGYIVSADKIV